MSNNGNHDYGADEEPTPANAVAPFSAEARELVNLALAIGATASSVWRVARIIDSVDGVGRSVAVAQCSAELAEIIDAATAAHAAINGIKGKP